MRSAGELSQETLLSEENGYVERWNNSEWQLETSESDDLVSVRLLRDGFIYSTTGSSEAYETGGITLTAGDETTEISVTVFPDNDVKSESSDRNAIGQTVSDGVVVHY
ncbi:putative uncharacterized protein [Corynebacterium casei UCMA 3821]|uniref:Uncharacterized protein n=1 Tax=Corynebacterium casei UCMA 3821 TaxID=1110505 RepID=G7HX60_9CORY|nr:putative uncharacterized protein [Corynebacterium casei UCMA 3821]